MDPTSLEFDIAYALKHKAAIKLKRGEDAELITKAIVQHATFQAGSRFCSAPTG